MTCAAPLPEMVGLYDRLAPVYDKLHRRWLRRAGGEAQVALEAVVRALATPATALLDVGCGTGVFARRLIAEGMSPERITLLDPSAAMLARCADLPVKRVRGRIEALPFPERSFDLVTCAWALETAPRRDLALSELRRVVRPGGALCVTFCATAPAGSLGGWIMRQAVLWRGVGRFLPVDQVLETFQRSGEFEARLAHHFTLLILNLA